ncbi:MAG: [protein-PII] uridylyltransferase [Nitrospiria bacterium]
MMKQSDEVITALRPLFTEKYNEIQQFHHQGGGGAQVVKALSDLADSLLLKGFQSLDPAFAQEWGGALIAIGGYGRQELAPHSDIDLMILVPGSQGDSIDPAISELICLLWDLGYKVGHSTRTIAEAISLARQDALIATSLLESRFLHGDRTLFKTFHETFFSNVIDKQIKGILSGLSDGRADGRREYGATPYLLEPNLKQSPGGLRDIHYLKWVSSARYHTHHLPQIHQWGYLSNIEYASLVEAQDFLWRVRNHLHFLAGKASDHLTIELQEEIAPFMKLKDRRGLMHAYYLHTGRVLEISKRFIREAYPVSRGQRWRRSWLTRQISPGFQVFSDELSIQSDKPFQFFDDDENILRLFLLSKTHGLRIQDAVLETIYQISEKKKGSPVSPGAYALFKTLMTEPGGIAKTLRLMHRTRFLWRIIPEFEGVHCMVQESRSHAFTVDEHSFRALETAESFLDQEGPLQEIYAKIQRKDVLHLGILLHDIGKGRKENHSEVGAKVADGVASRMAYPQDQADILIFLVRHHLMLSEIALYRDFTDEPILLQFAEEVGDVKILRKLFILTCADMSATAPGMWTAWKQEIFLNFFGEASKVLSGEVADPEDQQIEEIRNQLLKTARGQYPGAWLKETLQTLLPRYYLMTPFEQVLLDLRALSRLQTDPIQVEARYLSAQGVSEYSLYTYDWLTTGIFASMTGVLSAKGLRVLAAQVFTHPNGMVIDTFKVIDPDNKESVSSERVAEIRKDIRKVLTGRGTVEALFEKGRRFPRKKRAIPPQSPRIEVDNESSRAFTIIDVFAADKKGVLFMIAKSILELGLVVHAAKIATRLEQVVDVFYVLGADQRKIETPEAIQRIKDHLIRELKTQFESKEA